MTYLFNNTTTCSSCMSQISASASICPYCKTEQVKLTPFSDLINGKPLFHKNPIVNLISMTIIIFCIYFFYLVISPIIFDEKSSTEGQSSNAEVSQLNGEVKSDADDNEKRIYNIYISLRSGSKNYLLNNTLEKLKNCGIEASIADSNDFKYFRHGLDIVLTGPHDDLQDSRKELENAKLCGINGYSKSSN